MKSLPIPALVAALAAVLSVPFSGPAAVTLFVTTGLGAIIHADYPHRRQRLRLPRLPARARLANWCAPVRSERDPLAA